MATYAIGDIQGCLDSLFALLKKVGFDPQADCLWVAGDLVNRGPDSLSTLRFIKGLPNTEIVLGNHDLHLLAAARGHKTLSRKDTLQPVLEAPDAEELLTWLQNQKLAHHCPHYQTTMVHAGIPPIWDIEQTLSYALEVEAALQGEKADEFFAAMYGNTPERWDDTLTGTERLRVITNYLTRMRFCKPDGFLDLSTKTGANTAPPGYRPWFMHEHHKCRDNTILFGHWASLQGETGSANFIALDTGCVWGGSLTMLRLDDNRQFSVPCHDCCSSSF